MSPTALVEPIKLEVNDLNLYYDQKRALNSVSLKIPEKKVTAFIGPSGCGKSTLLRCFNRMNDLVDLCRVEGKILLDGHNIYDKSVDVAELRRQVGMVFQKPNPFPKSIYENVAYGLRLQGVKSKRVLDEVVEKSLHGAALWDEVKDRLHENAFGLSGGQQQRLVIARAIAIEPEVILLDEPASALGGHRGGEWRRAPDRSVQKGARQATLRQNVQPRYAHWIRQTDVRPKASESWRAPSRRVAETGAGAG